MFKVRFSIVLNRTLFDAGLSDDFDLGSPAPVSPPPANIPEQAAKNWPGTCPLSRLSLTRPLPASKPQFTGMGAILWQMPSTM